MRRLFLVLVLILSNLLAGCIGPRPTPTPDMYSIGATALAIQLEELDLTPVPPIGR